MTVPKWGLASILLQGAGVVCLRDGQVLLIRRGKAPLKGEWSIPGGRMELGEGATQAALRELKEETGVEAERGRVLLGFGLPSREAVDELFDELVTHEHQALQPPYDAFWGARYAIVEDPDGNPVGLMSPSDDAYRSEPPAI